MPELPQLPLLALLVRTIVEGIKGVLPAAALTEGRIKATVFIVSAGLIWASRVDIFGMFGLKTAEPGLAFMLNTVILGASSMGFHDVLDYLAGKR